ncbi:MAG: hypothetical protein M3010_09010, partial [Candidatus Dormibacteraeota bacterium]|nr:hypothetical protein [Candidatus Dormibacteraeota bacterium]
MDYQLEQWINAGAGANPAVDRLMVALAQWSEIAFITLVAAWFIYGVVRRAGSERVGAVAALMASGVGLA